MKNSRIALIALTTAAVLGVAACGSDSDSGSPDETVTITSTESSTSAPSDSSDTSQESSPQSGTGSQSPDSDGGLGAVTSAIEAAESETGGTAHEVDDQDFDGSWEIDLAKDGQSIEVEVSSDGTVTQREQDTLDEDDRRGLAAAKITIGEAIEKALAEVDGTFDEAELEEEGGTWYWQVEINIGNDQDRDVLVDVTNGKTTIEK